MLFGVPFLMLKSTKKMFSSFIAYWWWSNSLHLSRFHTYSWIPVFIIFNPTARKEKNFWRLNENEVHVVRTWSWRYMPARICINVISEIPFTKVWRSQSKCSMNYLSISELAAGLKKATNLKKFGWTTLDSIREL